MLGYFNDTWPAEQRKEWKEWRKYVMKNEHYTHPHGPGSLLFISDEHLRLLEACYLLSLKYSDYELRKEDLLSEDSLAKGREQWPYFPNDLSDKELRNPYRVLKKVFKKYKLAEYRDYLKEWLHAALYNSQVDEAMTAEEIITVYENIKKLASAAWMIRQTESNNPMLKKEYREPDKGPIGEGITDTGKEDQQTKANKADNATKRLDDSVGGSSILSKGSIMFKPFAPQATAAEKLGLAEVVSLILRTVPSARSITFLGSYHSPFTFYLLILIDETEKLPEHGIVNKIEDNCRPLVNVYAIVHKVESAINGLNGKGKFWNLVFGRGLNLYSADGLVLPTPLTISKEQDLAVRMASWNKYGLMSGEFFSGAERYLEDGNARLALFLLHQATETSLIGVLQVLLGYRQSVHNLFRLIKLTLLFTDEFKDVFEMGNEEGYKLFTLVQDGYSKARYDENFLVNDEMVRTALEKVRNLLQMAELVFKIK
ncbi:HEPN domain-containing protein [Mucilaginibacter sp.]|uniref:HEPN domain-containing protein n=1 Tax=Mucilaginibacter sp. TaxID=1882438 RepID=UPI0032640BA7